MAPPGAALRPRATGDMLTAMAAPRALVLGSGKTVHRYRRSLTCAGAEARSVEVLQFQVDNEAAHHAAAEIHATQKGGAAAGSNAATRRLRVILTSSVAVRILSEWLASMPDDDADATRTELLVVGPVTEAACLACKALTNVTFCAGKLRDVWDHLEQQHRLGHTDGIRTVLVGVATGGDRGYLARPVLRGAIEHWAIYDSVADAAAGPAIIEGLRWIGCGGYVVCTSSKTAEALAELVARDEKHASLLCGTRVVAQGPTTAASMSAALMRLGLRPPASVEAAAMPSAEAIGDMVLSRRATPRPAGSKGRRVTGPVDWTLHGDVQCHVPLVAPNAVPRRAVLSAAY
jgi:hypothetical protein